MKRFRTRAEEFRILRRVGVALLLVVVTPVILQTLLSLRFHTLRSDGASYSTLAALPWSCTSAKDNRGGSWDSWETWENKYCYGAGLRQFSPLFNPPPRPKQYELTCTGMSLHKLVKRAVTGHVLYSCSASPSTYAGRATLIRTELDKGDRTLGRSELSQMHFELALALDDQAGLQGGNAAIPLLGEALEHLEISLDLRAHLPRDNSDFERISLYRDRVGAKLKAWSVATR